MEAQLRFADAGFDLEEVLLVIRGEDDERLEEDERDEEVRQLARIQCA